MENNKPMTKYDREGRPYEFRAAMWGDSADSEKMTVIGRAVVYETPTVIWTDPATGLEYKEVIARGALDDADMTDVPLRYNHESGFQILARTRNNTLRLLTDDEGLVIEADLAPTTAGKDVFSLIEGRYLDKMSFAFTVAEDSFDRKTLTRTILKIDKLYDVSVVDVPAYDATYISARMYGERQAEEIRRMAERERRKRLALLAQV